jgi:2-polyprenyl-6-methoxyphenol hydroxylase-like FAD-dependent oxidoreductase
VVRGRERRGAVVGGSIAGCAAAIACGHAGLPVDVYERSGSEPAERGFGITMPMALHGRSACCWR